MIEIFDPDGVEYSARRADAELAAAEAAAFLKARAVHLALAAGHIDAVRRGGTSLSSGERIELPLSLAFPVTPTQDFDELLTAIDAVSQS